MKVPQLIDLITFWEACPTSHLANINFVSTLSKKNFNYMNRRVLAKTITTNGTHWKKERKQVLRKII